MHFSLISRSRFACLPLLVLLAPLGACAVSTPPVTAQAQVDVQAQVPPLPTASDGTAAVSTPAPGDTSGDAEAYQDDDPSALTDFHSALDSHGTWVDDPAYGTVWVPAGTEVGPTFVPYASSGHWAYDDDYVWVSDYDWGWAPFHYGRWVFVDGRGWAWIPGRVYRGAWVTWGADDGYGTVGWYPMAPSFVWRGGVAAAYTYTLGPRWVYCAHGDLFHASVGAHLLVGPAAAGMGERVHPMPGGGAAHGPSGGPPPEKLGYSGSTIPHTTGANAAGVAKAKQFASPSTAASMGAHAPAHSQQPNPHAGVGAHAAGIGPQGSPAGHAAPTTSTAPAGQNERPVHNPIDHREPATTTAHGTSSGPNPQPAPQAQQQPRKRATVPEEQPHGRPAGNKGGGGNKGGHH
jgi:hypothetical protein